MTTTLDSPVQSLPSIQLNEQEAPRFHIPFHGDRRAWERLCAEEAAGGVAPEFRTFLDAQLDSGDALLDFAPGFGLVAMSAATVPGIPVTAILLTESEHAGTALTSAAAAADTSLTLCAARPGEDASARFARAVATVPPAGRVFVHVSVPQLPEVLGSLDGLLRSGRVVAVLLADSPGVSEADWLASLQALTRAGCRPHQLAERDGDLMLLPAESAAAGTPVIAVYHLVIAPEETASGDSEQASAPDNLASPGMDRVEQTDLAVHSGAVAGSPVAWPDAGRRVNLLAPFQRTGYGMVGAHLLDALQSAGAQVAFFPMGAVDATVARADRLEEALAAQASFDPWAPSVRIAQQFDLALHVGRGPRIGFPIFESTQFSARERHHLRAQDRLLVCSEWARGVVIANGLLDVPVSVVPLGVNRAVFHEQVEPRSPVKTRDETVFLQVGKLEARKGQLELLHAFEAAFSPSDQVRLVLACHNPFLTAAQYAERAAPFRRSRMGSRITLIKEPLPTHADVAALMAAADCGVYCSRAEGWNLELLEMMSMGKPVVATAYSAHTAYATNDNAHLVEVTELAPAEAIGEWGAFGDAQHDQLVEHLRAIHARRQDGPLPLNEAGIETARQYSWAATAQALLGALQ